MQQEMNNTMEDINAFPVGTMTPSRGPKVIITTKDDQVDVAMLEANRKEVIGNLRKAISLQRVQAEKKVVIFMCGLPARGKSFLSKKLTRYLRWMGFQTQIFNVGNLRRLRNKTTDKEKVQDASFFSTSNDAAKLERERLAAEVLNVALDWLRKDGGQVAIHDATNSTIDRRRSMYEKATEGGDVQVIFVESICNDPTIIKQNMVLKLKGPDYIGMDPKKALEDFAARISNYEQVYDTITDEESDYAYIKVINAGRKVVARHIHSYLPSAICFFLMNIHLAKRPIWLARHGQSCYNIQGRIGGNSGLSPLGRKFAKGFAAFLKTKVLNPDVGLRNRCTSCPKLCGMDGINEGTFPLHKVATAHANINTIDSYARTQTTHTHFSYDNRNVFVPERESIEEGAECDLCSEAKRTDFAEQQRQRLEVPVLSFTSESNYGTPSKTEMVVWTSTLKRATQTTSYLPSNWIFNQSTMLNEIYTGKCEGMTHKQLMEELPMEFVSRTTDKLHYRYPGSGESYMDIMERIRPLIIDIERVEAPVVVVGHLSTLRVLYGYFMNIPIEEVPFLNFPLHTAVCLTEQPDGMEEKVFKWVGSEDSTSCSWEYLPDYSVRTKTKTKSNIPKTVADLGLEYQFTITEEAFESFQEEYKDLFAEHKDGDNPSTSRDFRRCSLVGFSINNSEMDDEEDQDIIWADMPTTRTIDAVSEKCGWLGCGMEFYSHVEFVAHIISVHCSQ